MPINSKGETSFASAGPYYVVNWTQGRSAEFDRNPNYTGSRPRNVDHVPRHDQHRPEPGFLQVKSGQVDYDVGGLAADAEGGARSSARLLNKQIFINPLAVDDVRRAEHVAGQPVRRT